MCTSSHIEGRFTAEIIPMEGHDADGILQTISTDEVIRGDTSLAQPACQLRPAQGTVTAGSSSAISDGASAMLVMTAD